jgi:hypothetical protein
MGGALARSIGWVAVGGLALCLVACGGGSAGSAVSAAIAGFDPSVGGINQSFGVLDVEARVHPADLRAAALAHLHDADPNRHFAAVYALALTAESGRGSTELAQLLTATSTTDRLLAAGSLLSIGDKSGIPVLIDALSSTDEVAFSSPGQFGFEFAQAELLYFTTQDFGLRSATGPAAVAATQAAWRQWWTAQSTALRFDPNARKYT